MPTFGYKALNESGNKVTGEVEAATVEEATNILVARGLIPEKIGDRTAGMKSGMAFFSGRVKVADLILFTKQFRSMLSAGVAILRLLQVLETQTQSRVLKDTIGKIVVDIRGGATLSEALQKFPRIFSPLYCAMIRAGELSGNVPSVLDRLIYIIEHEHKVKSDIKSALRYPFIVVIALGVAFVILLTVVVPKFVAMFSKSGLTLPLPTQIAVLLHAFLVNYWYLILGFLVIIIFALAVYFKTPQGKFVRDSFFLEIPIIGPVFKKAALSRFASIFAILQTSGVPVMQSLSILSETIGNEAIARAFENLRERIEEGAGISAPLKSSKYFTPMVVDMIAIGEESGNLDEMLREISKHYDDEVEYAVKGMSDAIGPILIVGLAAVVGFFALAIFMPMWDLTKLATR
ncbi:MAG TPA: type II secretion system F family protein [Smithellaceae bacterium]|mgnify:CR=1 FL=1|nr:type II secretion system F family protein [Smithellaceae bacterium]HPD50170.1 type II secretion system F family protein [Smithellaceae bacterium]HRT36495.1 type II secretion system F family protein [Smithellaceae bacterium]